MSDGDSGAFDPLAYSQSQGASAFDPLAYSAQNADKPVSKEDAKHKDDEDEGAGPARLHKAVTEASTYMMGPIGPALVQQVTGLGATVGAGAKTAYDAVTGKVKSIADADDAAQDFIRRHTFTPDAGSDAAKVSSGLASPLDPINWPGLATDKVGEGVRYAMDRPLGHQMPDAVRSASDYLGPLTTGALDFGIAAAGARAPFLGKGASAAPTAALTDARLARLSDVHLPLEQTQGKTLPLALPAPAPEAAAPLTAAGAPRAPSWEPRDPEAPAPMVDSEPARGGLALTDSQRAQRAGILARTGQQTARESALAGDAGNAGTDWQLTKFNQEPAGQAAAEQFEHEKQALTAHAQRIVKATGGTLGTDEDALNARGETIDAPFAALRQWFKDRSREDYDSVKAKFGDNPVGPLADTEKLLKDPDFTESLLAKNQGHFLDSAARQYERIKALNPDGFTVDNAEHFRKFLNSVWTPETSSAIGRITDAIDGDVTKAAGADVYAGARARVELKHRLLDDPDGVSTLFDTDPRTPINRSTALNQIPDKLTRLPPAQFSNVLKTLDQMPEELQPQAQAAKAEIKAHLANKLLQAGSETRSGRPRQGQWESGAVTQVLKANSAKFREAFKDDPKSLAMIQDLDSAGRINQTDQAYPGAAAQAANAVKRGMMSHAITRGAAGAGASLGGALGSIAGPAGTAVGAATGAAAGEALGSRAGQSLGEGKALKSWQKRVTKLSDLMNGPESK